jgi:hypothetical protein
MKNREKKLKTFRIVMAIILALSMILGILSVAFEVF